MSSILPRWVGVAGVKNHMLVRVRNDVKLPWALPREVGDFGHRLGLRLTAQCRQSCPGGMAWLVRRFICLSGSAMTVNYLGLRLTV